MIYDPYSREMQEEPYPTYRYFRDEEPCHFNEEAGFYALFRFEDVWNATLDWETMSSSYGPILEVKEKPEGTAFSIIGMDPPLHTRLRNVVSRGFTPRRIRAIEEQVRPIARAYLDRFQESRGFDIQQEFAVKFPMDVISVLLGIPAEDRDEFRYWTDMSLARDPETGAPPPEALATMGKSNEYALALLGERRKNPKEDLISVLAQAEYEDMDGNKKTLSDPEVSAFITLLGAAGAETTAKLIGNAVVFLAAHPDQRARLWEDPQLIPRAIEEVLRFDPPSQFQGRVALRESTWHGVTIPKYARVALVTAAACHDEREFENADQFDIARNPSREIYFGHGHHVCIGKSLARLEMRIALEEFSARFPDYEVDESALTRTYQAHVRGFANVPIHW